MESSKLHIHKLTLAAPAGSALGQELAAVRVGLDSSSELGSHVYPISVGINGYAACVKSDACGWRLFHDPPVFHLLVCTLENLSSLL